MFHAKKITLSKSFLILLALFSSAVNASGVTRTICVFDPVGTSGDIYNVTKDYQAKALAWTKDLKLELKAFIDESVIVDNLKAGKCDGVVMTSLKTRNFNLFTSTIEAVGAIPNAKVLRTALEILMTLPDAKAHVLLRNGPYEVAGIMPAGALYPFMRNCSWNKLNKIQGKKISVLEGDAVSANMVHQVGATPVSTTTTNFAGKFNSGFVDVVFAPAAAYLPLELYRGLGDQGCVTRYPIGQMTLQFLIRHDRFPEDFGFNARRTALDNFDSAFKFIEDAIATIDPKHWATLPDEERLNYDNLMISSRVALKDQGVYDGKMLRLLRKIRCTEDPSSAECVQKLE